MESVRSVRVRGGGCEISEGVRVRGGECESEGLRV